MKILVIKVAALGDFLMATPALRALKQAPRVSALHVLAGRSIAPVAGNDPDVDRVFYLDDRRLFRGGTLARALEALKASWRLRRERYDAGFSFHRDRRFAVILFLAGCRRRIGFSRAGRRPWLLTDAVPVEGIKHHIFHYCDLLKPLGIICMDFKMSFPVTESALAAAWEKFLAQQGPGAAVVLVPGGAANVKEEMESRRWPAEYFAALAGLLLAANYRVLLLGSGNDATPASRIKEAQPAVVDLTDRTSLPEAAAILKQSLVVVCNDSGLMHLAAAVGARVISLFGPTHPGEKKPLDEGSIALWKGEGMECSPCYHDGVFPKCDHLECLRQVTPEEVFELAQKMINEPNSVIRDS